MIRHISFFSRIAVSVFFLFGVPTALALPVTPSHVVVFGDSLSDAGMNTQMQDSGNNTWARFQGKTGAPATSLDASTRTHPLWINFFLAKQFPLTFLFPVRVAKQLGMHPSLVHVSYAYAAAETGDHYLNDIAGEKFPPTADALCQQPGKISDSLACVPGILKQIDLYLADVTHPRGADLYLIWAGGNDIFNNVNKIISMSDRDHLATLPATIAGALKTSFFPTETPDASAAVIFPDLSHPIYNLLQAKNRLIAAGVKPEQIYFIDLPDLSKTPAGIQLAKGNPVILAMLSQVSSTFNFSLRAALVYNPLDKNSLPVSHVLSSHDLLNEIFAHPDKYGMTHLAESCVADKKDPLCEGYFFFNDKHPTAKTGKILGEGMAEQVGASR